MVRQARAKAREGCPNQADKSNRVQAKSKYRQGPREQSIDVQTKLGKRLKHLTHGAKGITISCGLRQKNRFLTHMQEKTRHGQYF